jgi:hypothetical protein
MKDGTAGILVGPSEDGTMDGILQRGWSRSSNYIIPGSSLGPSNMVRLMRMIKITIITIIMAISILET